jgi:hypothetical protein
MASAVHDCAGVSTPCQQVRWETMRPACALPASFLISLLVTGCLLTVPCEAQTSASYNLSRGVAGTGASTLSSTTYRLSGSFGQPAAARLTSTSFALTGGFWTRPAPIQGDVDGDGRVDVVDLLSFVVSFGTYSGDPAYVRACDLDRSGSVDVVDLIIMVENFGKH